MPGPFLQVGGAWDIVQRNGFRVQVIINQDQDRLSAFASHSDGRVQSLEATGFVQGPNFELTITWNNNTKGKYTGVLTKGHFDAPLTGYLDGNTIDLLHPESQSTWYSERRLFSIQ